MSGRRFVFNAGWSLASQLLPLAVAVLTIPLLIRAIGLERFGFLSIAWTLVGFAGLFDLGIRRAVTRVVAEKLGAGDPVAARLTANGALFVVLAIGLVMCVGMELAAGLLATHWLDLPATLRGEATNALRILALSLPIVLTTNVYGGILAGHQRFKSLSVVLIVMGVFNYLTPLLVTLFTTRLEALVAAVVLSRFVTNHFHQRVCVRATGASIPRRPPDAKTLRDLFRVGGWTSVMNVAGPLLALIDRFVLASRLPVAQLAYYTTPADMTSKLTIFPNAVMSILIPAMAHMQQDKDALSASYYTSTRFSFAMMLPATLILITFAHPVMHLWLGETFANEGYRVMQWFAVGVCFYTLAQPASVLIIGAGDPKWMALAMMVELPLVALMLFYLVSQYGIAGAAMSWALRYLLEGLVFVWMAHRWVLRDRPPVLRSLVQAGVGVAAVLAPQLLDRRVDQAVAAAFVLPLLLAAIWRFVLTDSDRLRIAGFVRRRGTA